MIDCRPSRCTVLSLRTACSGRLSAGDTVAHPFCRACVESGFDVWDLVKAASFLVHVGAESNGSTAVDQLRRHKLLPIVKVDAASRKLRMVYHGRPSPDRDTDLTWQYHFEKWAKHMLQRHRAIVRPLDTRSPAERKVQWQLLPPGTLTVETISDHMRTHSDGNDATDQERVEHLLSLSPSRVFRGTDGFGGYVGFEFGSRVVLECARRGNAIFVIQSNFDALSGLTKQELMARNGDAVRIVHQGDWKARLAAALAYDATESTVT